MEHLIDHQTEAGVEASGRVMSAEHVIGDLSCSVTLSDGSLAPAHPHIHIVTSN